MFQREKKYAQQNEENDDQHSNRSPPEKSDKTVLCSKNVFQEVISLKKLSIFFKRVIKRPTTKRKSGNQVMQKWRFLSWLIN